MNSLAWWIALAGVIGCCLTSLGVRSLHEFPRHELADICRRRNRPELLGEILLRHVSVATGLECLQTLATVLTVAAGLFAFWTMPGVHPAAGPGLGGLAGGIVAGWVVLVAAEIWLPAAIARLWSAPFLFRTWAPWKLISQLMIPLVACASVVDTIFHRLAGKTPAAPTPESIEDEIRSIVTEGHREGLLEEDAREMIEGVIDLRDAYVSEIMTPRTDMISVSVGLPWTELLTFVNSVGHTRIPVYDKNRDDIVGILYVKDLLPELSKEPGVPRKPVSELLRKPYFVPETKPVDALLAEFQRTRNHMAIVLDEYGGVSGLITIEDVLEEIVGEIVDEYDEVLVEGIKPLGERSCEALARVHIDEINERMHLDLPDEAEYDTIGGYVFHALGRIPARNESVVWNNVRITVVEVSRRRIERVRIEVLDPTELESA